MQGFSLLHLTVNKEELPGFHCHPSAFLISFFQLFFCLSPPIKLFLLRIQEMKISSTVFQQSLHFHSYAHRRGAKPKPAAEQHFLLHLPLHICTKEKNLKIARAVIPQMLSQENISHFGVIPYKQSTAPSLQHTGSALQAGAHSSTQLGPPSASKATRHCLQAQHHQLFWSFLITVVSGPDFHLSQPQSNREAILY